MRQEANRHRHDLNLLPKTFVLSADKGNCVVVMDKQQYHDKALSLLNDKSTYAVLNSDPTRKTQGKLNKMSLGKFSDSTYKILYSSDGFCPRLYGLPKIHKPGIPLRPIVPFVNSPTYAISGYLARILSPVVGNTEYTVKNSCEFADFNHNVKVAQKPSKRLQLICIGDTHVLN